MGGLGRLVRCAGDGVTELGGGHAGCSGISPALDAQSAAWMVGHPWVGAALQFLGRLHRRYNMPGSWSRPSWWDAYLMAVAVVQSMCSSSRGWVMYRSAQYPFCAGAPLALAGAGWHESLAPSPLLGSALERVEIWYCFQTMISRQQVERVDARQ